MSTLSLSTFDTLAYVKRLKEADVPEKQAEVQAEALREALRATLDEQSSALATKGDVALVRKDVEAVEQRLNARVDALENRLLLKLGGMLIAGFATVIAILVRLLG